MKGFGQITRKYLGRSFDECNCLSLLYSIYQDAKIDVPNSYKGYDLNSYMSYWEEKPEQAISDMIELFKTIGEEINPKFLTRGDIVVIKFRNSTFPSIYVGNNSIMFSTKENGVVTIALGSRFHIILARRLI